MNELQQLREQRAEVMAKIRTIESNCEGIENAHNAQQMQQLHQEQSELTSRKALITEELNTIQTRLTAISQQVTELAATGMEKIKKAIASQRWFFFENNDKIIFDKDTCLLWANLRVYPYSDGGVQNAAYFGGIKGFRYPTFDELRTAVYDKSIPFHEGGNWRLMINHSWSYAQGGTVHNVDLDNWYCYDGRTLVFPCSDIFFKDIDYKSYAADKVQHVLDLFVEYKLLPIFTCSGAAEVKSLYQQIFLTKPQLLAQLQSLQDKISELEQVHLLSSDFDYHGLLDKYNLTEIASSALQYASALRSWCQQMGAEVQQYSLAQQQLLAQCRMLTASLISAYSEDEGLEATENALLRQRREYLRRYLHVDMGEVAGNLLNLERQAEELEQRIEAAYGEEDSLAYLAQIEEEQRASFPFVAENTGRMLKNALLKVEFVERNLPVLRALLTHEEGAAASYRHYKTVLTKEFSQVAQKQHIELAVSEELLEQWQQLRYGSEAALTQLLKIALSHEALLAPQQAEQAKSAIVLRLLTALEEYTLAVDEYYSTKCLALCQGGTKLNLSEVLAVYEAVLPAANALARTIGEQLEKIEDLAQRRLLHQWGNELWQMLPNAAYLAVLNAQEEACDTKLLERLVDIQIDRLGNCLSDAQAYSELSAERGEAFNKWLSERGVKC